MNRSRSNEQFDEYLWPLAGVAMSFNWSALEAHAAATRSPAIDEYLWPLDGLTVSFDWEAVQEHTAARERLEAIYDHVLMTHVPRARQQTARPPSSRLPSQMASAVIEGAPDAPLWEWRLKAPVPKALRDEWNGLCEVIRGQRQPREMPRKAKRTRPH